MKNLFKFKNNDFIGKCTFGSILCLIFNVISVFLFGAFCLLEFVNVFALSKELSQLTNVFYILSLVFCSLSFIITTLIVIQRKKRNIEKSAFSKVNGLIILNFVVSGYILFIYIFIFISSLIK